MLSQPNSEAPGGVGSAMSSIDKGSKDGDKADEGPPYTPLVPEQWQEQIRAMQNLHVVKFRRIFQSLFYFLKYRERADISLVDTNRLEWKKCRKLLAKNSIEEEDLFASLGNYWPFAPKDDEYKEYQKLAFIFDNISVINEEQVDDYSIALGQLFRWLRQAVDLRIENVKSRRARQRKLTEERQDATDKEAERCERREEELEKAKEAFAEAVREQKEQKAKEKGSDEEEEEAEEDPEFEEENFLLKFDDENPPIEIPPEVVEDVDNDFNLEDEGEEPGEE